MAEKDGDERASLDRLIHAFDNLDSPIQDLVTVTGQTQKEIRQLKVAIYGLLIFGGVMAAMVLYTTHKLGNVTSDISAQKRVNAKVVSTLRSEFQGKYPELRDVSTSSRSVGAE